MLLAGDLGCAGVMIDDESEGKNCAGGADVGPKRRCVRGFIIGYIC